MEQYQQEFENPFKGGSWKFIILIVGAILFLVISWSSITATIESGSRGVLYKKFAGGVDTEEPSYGPGLHFIMPWNDMIVYETRQQEMKETMEVLSSNLLKIQLDVTVLYQPDESALGLLEVTRGKSYHEKVVRPVTRSVVRKVMAKYLPEEINTTKREEIELEIRDGLREGLNTNYVQLNELLIRNIVLPPTLQAAIERKLKQEQESLEYEFRIEKAQKEAERKKIEADGIRKFQEIVSKSITKDLLKWKGIEATETLAKSPNSKIVIVGNDGESLPVILNADK